MALIYRLSYGCQEIAWRIDAKNVARGEARGSYFWNITHYVV